MAISDCRGLWRLYKSAVDRSSRNCPTNNADFLSREAYGTKTIHDIKVTAFRMWEECWDNADFIIVPV